MSTVSHIMIGKHSAYFTEEMKSTYFGLLQLVSEYSDLYRRTVGVNIFTLRLLETVLCFPFVTFSCRSLAPAAFR
jgi:hypothetical protein